MDAELTALQKKLRQFSGAKNKLGQKMDKLDISDRHYDRKYQNMETRMYALYDEIDAVEQSISEIETGILDARQQKISGDNVYQFLLYYHKLYDKFSDAEKKEFMNSFIEKVGIFPQEQSDGRFLRSISFQFPVFFDGKEVQKLSWDSESTVECVVRLSRKTPDDVIHVDLDLTDLPLTKAEAAATYTQIKEYVLEQTGLKVSSLYVSQVKRKCGLEVGDSYNKPKSDDKKQPQCPPEKESAIMKALEHFKMI